jgi:hypothetical protein
MTEERGVLKMMTYKELVRKIAQERICKRLKVEPRISFREKKSIQMKAVWEAEEEAAKKGIVVEDIGEGIEVAWEVVGKPKCPLPEEEKREKK